MEERGKEKLFPAVVIITVYDPDPDPDPEKWINYKEVIFMKCVFYGGKLKNENVTFTYEDEDKYLFVEDVPAEVCTSCGEKTYSTSVTDDLLKFTKNEFHLVKTIKVPVFNFTERV